MVTCPHCGHEPPAGSAFCNGCGGCVILCAGCGATPPPGSRFCNGCGALLVPGDPAPVARPAAREERKVVSVVFVDLMGSTALQERLDPESVNRVMDAYYGAVRGPVEAAGGTVVQLLGDGVFCAFGIPRVAEDDALRAVRAAVESTGMRRRLRCEGPRALGGIARRRHRGRGPPPDRLRPDRRRRRLRREPRCPVGARARPSHRSRLVLAGDRAPWSRHRGAALRHPRRRRRLRERAFVADHRGGRPHHAHRAVRARAPRRGGRAARGAAPRSAADPAQRGDARQRSRDRVRRGRRLGRVPRSRRAGKIRRSPPAAARRGRLADGGAREHEVRLRRQQDASAPHASGDSRRSPRAGTRAVDLDAALRRGRGRAAPAHRSERGGPHRRLRSTTRRPRRRARRTVRTLCRAGRRRHVAGGDRVRARAERSRSLPASAQRCRTTFSSPISAAPVSAGSRTPTDGSTRSSLSASSPPMCASTSSTRSPSPSTAA